MSHSPPGPSAGAKVSACPSCAHRFAHGEALLRKLRGMYFKSRRSRRLRPPRLSLPQACARGQLMMGVAPLMPAPAPTPAASNNAPHKTMMGMVGPMAPSAPVVAAPQPSAPAPMAATASPLAVKNAHQTMMWHARARAGRRSPNPCRHAGPVAVANAQSTDDGRRAGPTRAQSVRARTHDGRCGAGGSARHDATWVRAARYTATIDPARRLQPGLRIRVRGAPRRSRADRCR